MNEDQNIENQVDENETDDNLDTFTSRDFLDSLLDGKNLEAEQMFQQMISDRLSSELSDFQENIASAMFNKE